MAFEHRAFSIFPKALCRVYRSGNQTNIPNNTFTKVLLNAKSYDPGNYFDTSSTYRFIAPIQGYYLVIVNVGWTSVVADKRYAAYIYRNGGTFSLSSSHSGALTSSISNSFSDILRLNVNDYIELYVYHSAGVDTVSILGTQTQTFMAIHLLSVVG